MSTNFVTVAAALNNRGDLLEINSPVPDINSDNDVTTLADLDLAATTASTGLVAQLNTAGGSLSYSTVTHQFSGACGTSSTLSQANGNALIALLNTAYAAAKVGAASRTVNHDVALSVNLANTKLTLAAIRDWALSRIAGLGLRS